MSELRCMICGMKVNKNNYMINDNSFTEKNKEDSIIYCPFCGVGSRYLSAKDEEYKVKSLNEEIIKILDNAMKLEVFNGEFYREASKLAVSEEVKKLFKDLSSIEFFHARVHMRIGGFDTLPSLHKPDYGKHNTDELLLLEASKREKHAVHFYERYKNKISDKRLQEILDALSEVEKQHIAILK